MIIGVFLRNFKTYAGINYIPLTNGHNFCGLVGNNGIGKSSVLESLDCLLNNRSWNLNVVVKKSGMSTTRPHIVPVYFFSEDKVLSKNLDLFKKLSEYVWNVEESDINPQSRVHFKAFLEQRERLKNHSSNYLLIPLGLSFDHIPNLSIFNTRKLVELVIDDTDGQKSLNQLRPIDLKTHFDPLFNDLKQIFEYVYIPKDIDPEIFTQLETKEIQLLMGQTLSEIVSGCVPSQQIQEINNNLNGFIDSLSRVLGEYSFRTPGQRQLSLRRNNIYKLIINEYFKVRKLHKKEGGNWLELNDLSSGEKQKAILELAFQLMKNYRSRTDNLIIAIDEPESSLHMSACYDQFNKLFEMSKLCSQLLFATHWYGFIPTVQDGYISVISKVDNQHKFDLINVSRYRESVRQVVRESRGKLPYDIRLKGLNDFVQSIFTSILSDEPYNWLICEGSSDKLYLEAYFSDIKEMKKLRIVPVGGASEIKRIYNNLEVPYEDFKNDIRGKVILISDTDSEIVQYETKDQFRNLICRRIVNDESKRETVLVKIDSNPVSPKTEIEDALNGKVFFETLQEFKDDYPQLLAITDKEVTDITEEPAYFAMDLSPSKRRVLESFFDEVGVKFKFADKYSEKIRQNRELYKTPKWIEEIRNLL